MIETPRLILRRWRDTDVDAFANINASPEVMHYFPNTLSREDTDQMMVRLHQHFEDWGYGFYATEMKLSGEMIGFIGLGHPRFENEFTPCVEIGWRLDHRYWNQGLATEGAIAVKDYAFQELKLPDLYSWTATINKPSERIMQKLGMSYIKNFIHPNLDANHPLAEHVVYRLSNEDY